MGPVVNRTQYDKVRGMIQRAIDNGDGKLVCGGVDRPETIVGVQDSEKGFFIRPTIFMDVKESSEIWKNEIFGPGKERI